MGLISLKVRVSRVVVLTALVIFSLVAMADAQSRRPRRPTTKSDFHVGQKVEFEFLGKIYQGEVTEILGTGWVKASFKWEGRDQDSIFPPDKVWLPKKPAAAKKAAPKTPIRTWTDSTGKFKVDGRFVSLQDGKVTLEKEDGTRKTLPLDKLSDEDQEEAKKAAAKMPAVNPFEGSDDADSSAGAKTESSGSSAEPLNDEEIVATKGDWSSVRDVVADVSSKGKFEPDAAGDTSTEMHTVMMDLTKGAKDRNFSREKPAGLFLDRSRQRLIVASTNDDKQGGQHGARLEACDLASGKSLGAIVFDTGLIPRDMSPDGSSVVCVPDGLVSAFHKQRGVEVWHMEGGGKLAKRWDPNGTGPNEEFFKVGHAMFITRDLLLTDSGMGGKLTVWDVENARAVYTIASDSSAQPALSANRKQLATICSGFVCVFEAQTGKTLLALINDDGTPIGRAAAKGRHGSHNAARLAFRPDGCQLAALGSGVLEIWDLQKQSLVHQIWLPGDSARNMSESVDWIDNNYVLINKSDLVDLAKEVVLWHYDVPGLAHGGSAVINGRLAYGSAENHGGAMRAGVFFATVPHPEALQVAASLADEKSLVLKPGAQVSFDLRIPASNAQDLDAIAASYTNQLRPYNVSVANGAPLVFEAAVEAGKTESRTYRIMGRGFAQETVNVTEQKCRLALVENGKVLWERTAQAVGPGFMITHKEGETVQATVDRSSQEAVLGFFRNCLLPGRLARQGEHGAYGFSHVTPMGLVAYDPTVEPVVPAKSIRRR